MRDRRQFMISGSAALLLPSVASAQGPALYRCEGCDGVFDRPAESLSSSYTITEAEGPGEPMVLKGQVFQTDGTTPASGVVIYAYHTDHEGLYANGSDESRYSRRHGRLRGWVKTDAEGRYEFRSIKPAPYPGTSIPAHIHPTILEPGRRPYWIDDVVFDGEAGVTNAYRRRMSGRGGNGIILLQRDSDGTWIAVRNITLERHPA